MKELLMRSFEQNLEKYAEIIIKVGLNLQPGQRLLITGPLQSAPLVRLIAKHAYQRGARYVDTYLSDDQIKLLRFQLAPRDSFEEFSSTVINTMASYGRQ